MRKDFFITLGLVTALAGAMLANADSSVANVPDTMNHPNLIQHGSFDKADANGMPVGWSMQSFRNHPAPTIKVIPRDDGNAGNMVSIKFHPPAAAGQCLSFYHRLPELDGNRNVRFSFKYKLGGQMHVGGPSFSISSAPGCEPPNTRTWLTPVMDGQWHSESVDIPLPGLKGSGSVIEFDFNDLADSDQTIYIADVKMVYLDDTARIELSFKQPISGVLFTDDPNHTVSGAIRTWKDYSGKPVRIKVSPFDKPEQAIKSTRITAASPKAEWSLDLSNVPVGKYYVSAELLGDGESVIDTAKQVFSRIEPSQDIPRIIDGVTYYKGKPFLPIGIMHVADWVLDHASNEGRRIGAPTITREEMLSSIEERGFNCVVMHRGDTPEFVQECLKHGLMPFPTAAVEAQADDAARDHILEHKNVPNMLGWYGMDEPVLGDRMNRALSIYKMCKEYDPHRIVWACAYMPGPLTALDYEGTFADAVLVDRYEVRSTTSDLSLFGDYTRAVAEHAAKNPGLLVGVAPQVFVYLGPEPTVEQMRAQTYSGIVNGAKAFVFYSYGENFASRFSDWEDQYPVTPEGMSKNPKRNKWWIPDSVLWDAFPELNAEIRSLETIILSKGEPFNVQADAGKIQWMARTVDGKSYLIAVNPTAEEQKATFTLPSKQSLTGMLGTPDVKSSAGEIDLTFKGYEVKVFGVR